MLRLSALALSWLAASAAAAAPITVKDAKVAFVARATGGLKVSGESSKLAARDEGDSYRFVLKPETLDTGIGLRDNHMRKALEVEKFPTAQIVIPKADVAGKASGSLKGKLTLHGITKPISITYRSEAGGGGLAVSASLKVDMKQFAIETPSYLGVSVKPEVEIEVQFTGVGLGS